MRARKRKRTGGGLIKPCVAANLPLSFLSQLSLFASRFFFSLCCHFLLFSCSWFKEGRHHLLDPLPQDPRYVRMHQAGGGGGGGEGGLLVRHADERDVGNYRCVRDKSWWNKEKCKLQKPTLRFLFLVSFCLLCSAPCMVGRDGH